MDKVQPLPVEALYSPTDPGQLGFKTTDDLQDIQETLGQSRAVDAIRFGVGMERKGYNIYAMGPSGVGKRSLVQRHFYERAAIEPTPPDWVYVFNFENEYKPCVFSLPAGKGTEFQREMERFVNDMRGTLQASFESDEYQARRQVIEQKYQEQQEKALESVQEKARQSGFTMVRTPGGMVFAPMRDGEVLSPEQFQNLSDEERSQIEAHLEELQNELQQVLQRAPGFQREAGQDLKRLNQEITEYAVGGQIDDLQAKYAEFSQIVSYLEEVEKDVIDHAGDFLSSEENMDGNRLMAVLTARMQASQEASLQRYNVNLLVDNRELNGAPVIFEDNPTYQNLVGRVEHTAQMGALTTNFTLIKAGALHRANGGYLILDARKVLQQPYAWEGLKRTLQSGQIRIESLGQMLSVISTTSLEPEPIPLDVKVALFGDRDLYYLLQRFEPEFDELFKVQADFEDIMERNESQKDYARLIATIVREHQLHPFDSGAVARVIEQSSRMVEDSERLTTEVDKVTDLLQEADYWSRQNGQTVVTAADVQKAIDAQIYRADRLRERVQETILRGTFLIDTSGEVVGQVNGLSVIQLGGFAFGRPSRITASVRMGKGDVIDIEREVDMSGPIHSKGVLILSGFLNERYAQERPLSLSASLVFEQSYSGVEGDSASSAELYALLSAIAEEPVRQSLAVTGAINQKGQVQAIGGVNEKIEGFFDICVARGLTGDQGVLIPATNVKHLMLREDVRRAVADGNFKIFPVEHIDQGIELLTGMPAGEPDEEGSYPEGTINGKVQARLKRLAELAEKRQAKAQAEAKIEMETDGARKKEANE